MNTPAPFPKVAQQNISRMKKYLVSVSQEVCDDFEVEAETTVLAEEKALADFPWSSGDWCEGHMGSRKASVVEQLDE
jgi:hypothetical protein